LTLECCSSNENECNYDKKKGRIEAREGGYLCSTFMFKKNTNKMQTEKAEQVEKFIRK